MKVMDRFKDKTVSGAAKDRASSFREAVEAARRQAASTARDARKQALSTAKDARKQAASATKDARKQSRRQMMKARIAAARATGRDGNAKKSAAAAGAAGIAGAYFFDPESGKRRRHVARDRALSLIRQGTDTARRQAEYRKGQVEGKMEAAKSKVSQERSAADDQTLADRVKSEIFQPADAPKGSVNVNVERGIVYLRGEVNDRQKIEELVKQAGSIDGVAGVENLLHTS
jgi:osmotically-inducible protein OsmY